MPDARRVLIPPDLDAARLRAARIDAPVRSLSGATMGTGWSLRFAAAETITNTAVVSALEAVFSDIISQVSGWERGSDLSRYNRAAAGAWVELPVHLYTVLARAIGIAGLTDGAFNPALADAVERIGFGPSGEIASGAPVSLASWRGIRLDPARRAALQPGGAALDLSSIGKGHAVDVCAARLGELGVASFLMEIGGEFVGVGVKPDGQPWWVELGLSDQPSAADEPARTFAALSGLALATSGDFVRRREVDGATVSHLLDGRTGEQVAGGLSGVSVLHASCMEADGWATALFALGPEAGLAMADAQGLVALFAVRGEGGSRVTLSAKAREMLE